MIPAQFPGLIWITISSVVYGISCRDRLVVSFLKEQAELRFFTSFVPSNRRPNEILPANQYLSTVNFRNEKLDWLPSLRNIIDKINYIFIMRFEGRKNVAPEDKLILPRSFNNNLSHIEISSNYSIPREVRDRERMAMLKARLNWCRMSTARYGSASHCCRWQA